MPEKPTTTSLVQGEGSLLPKIFLQPEMSNKGSKQINVWAEKWNEKKKHIRNIFLQYSCMVLSTNEVSGNKDKK